MLAYVYPCNPAGTWAHVQRFYQDRPKLGQNREVSDFVRASNFPLKCTDLNYDKHVLRTR